MKRTQIIKATGKESDVEKTLNPQLITLWKYVKSKGEITRSEFKKVCSNISNSEDTDAFCRYALSRLYQNKFVSKRYEYPI